MFRLITAVALATLPLTAPAADEPTAAPQVVALQTQHDAGAAARAPLDEYTGVYRTADGALFVVERSGDTLAIELPETFALPIRAAAGGSFVLGPVVEIAFENGVDGEPRMIVSVPASAPVVATRVALPRGVVTIQDI